MENKPCTERTHRIVNTMKKIFYIYFGLSILFTLSVMGKEKISVASSPKHISYYMLAKSMSDIFDTKNIDYQIKPLATHGSVENINMLLKGKADMAIVQNDVAYFAKNGLRSFSTKNNNLRIVLPLFKEPIFILTRLQNVHDVSELKNKKIVTGEQKGGLTESAKVILNSMGIWENIRQYNLPQENALKRLVNGSVDAIFVNNLSQEMKKLIKEEKIFIVPISNRLVKKLHKTFPYFYTHKYTLNDTESIPTIAVRAILIATTNMSDENIYKITEVLVENYNALIFPDKYHTPKDELFNVEAPLEWHDGVKLYFKKHNIKPASNIIWDRYFWYIVIAGILVILLVLFVISFVLYQLGWLYVLSDNSKFLLALRRVYLYAIQYKYILIIVFMTLSYAVSILIVKYFEHEWAIEHNITSAFDEMPFTESLLWLFIFGSTGYNGDFFPNSSEGKLIVSLIPMIGLGGFFALVGLVTSDRIKKYILEGKGMSKVNFKDHIIICGWNERTPKMIENLLHENLTHKRPIVILTDQLESNPIEKVTNKVNKEFIKYVKGKGTDREALERANLEEADTAIIISDIRSSDPDARTILNVLTIEKFCNELLDQDKRSKSRGSIYTIAEIVDKNNYMSAKDANVDQVISLGDIESRIFTQSVQNPGVVKFIDEIFTYNEFNDIYSIHVDEKCKLLHKTYDEILTILRHENVLLLSINIEARREGFETEKILDEEGLRRSVITNPIEESERKYKVRVDDILIVLARKEEDLNKAKEKISKM